MEEQMHFLCEQVRQTAYAVHEYLRHGHFEKVYQNALCNRLLKNGLQVHPHYPINVYDEDGTLLGEFYADLLVEKALLVELKACQTIAPEHEAQILGYLKASRIEHGLLINFGSYKFQIRKLIWTQDWWDRKHLQTDLCFEKSDIEKAIMPKRP